jgi:hypothetical protein
VRRGGANLGARAPSPRGLPAGAHAAGQRRAGPQAALGRLSPSYADPAAAAAVAPTPIAGSRTPGRAAAAAAHDASRPAPPPRPPSPDTRFSAAAFAASSSLFFPWLLAFSIGGPSLLGQPLFDALDATRLDVWGILTGA